MCLISVADPALKRRLVWRPPVVPSNLAFLTILWSSLGCEDDSVWAGHGLLGGGRKTSAHGSEAAAFIYFGACSRVGSWVLTTAASLQRQSSHPQQKWRPAPRDAGPLLALCKGSTRALLTPSSCWKSLVWKAGLDDRTYWKQIVFF